MMRRYFYRFRTHDEWHYAVNQGLTPGESLGDIQHWAIRKYGRIANLGTIDIQAIPVDADIENGGGRWS